MRQFESRPLLFPLFPRTSRLLLVVAALAISGQRAFSQSMQSDATAATKIALAARLSKLARFSFSFEDRKAASTQKTLPDEMELPGGRVLAPIKAYTMSTSFSRLDDKVRREVHMDTATANTTVISIFTGDHNEQLEEHGGSYLGVIEREPSSISSKFVESGLGLCGYQDNVLFNKDDIAKMEVSRQPNGHWVVHRTVQTTIEEWEFAPESGDALAAYRTRVAPDHHINVEVTASGFQAVDGIMLPTGMHWHILSGEDGTATRETSAGDVTLHDYKLNDPDNTDERYHMKWPPGTRIADRLRQVVYTAGPNGETAPGSTFKPDGPAPTQTPQPSESPGETVKPVAPVVAVQPQIPVLKRPYILLCLTALAVLTAAVIITTRKVKKG